jgi:hypothetical protein
MEECCGPQKVEEALSKLEDIDPLTKMTVEEYAGLILTSAEELAKENVIRKKFWNLLKSIAKK